MRCVLKKFSLRLYRVSLRTPTLKSDQISVTDSVSLSLSTLDAPSPKPNPQLPPFLEPVQKAKGIRAERIAALGLWIRTAELIPADSRTPEAFRCQLAGWGRTLTRLREEPREEPYQRALELHPVACHRFGSQSTAVPVS